MRITGQGAGQLCDEAATSTSHERKYVLELIGDRQLCGLELGGRSGRAREHRAVLAPRRGGPAWQSRPAIRASRLAIIHHGSSCWIWRAGASRSTPGGRGTRAEAAAQYEGRLISGRYGQTGDSHGDLIDQVIEGPSDLPPQFAKPEVWAVPHQEIAVDSPQRSSAHLLYGPTQYAEQYVARFNTAVLHVRKRYKENTAA